MRAIESHHMPFGMAPPGPPMGIPPLAAAPAIIPGIPGIPPMPGGAMPGMPGIPGIFG